MITQPQHYPYSGVIPNIVLDRQKEMNMQYIMQKVCSFYKVKDHLIIGRSRERWLAMPRQVFCYLTRKHTNETLKNIGQWLRRDHTTIIAAVIAVNNMIETDEQFKDELSLLESTL